MTKEIADGPVGKFLFAGRRSKGFSRKEAAEMINCSPVQLSSWEAGKILPPFCMLKRMAEIYDQPALEVINVVIDAQRAIIENRKK